MNRERKPIKPNAGDMVIGTIHTVEREPDEIYHTDDMDHSYLILEYAGEWVTVLEQAPIKHVVVLDESGKNIAVFYEEPLEEWE